MSGRANLTTSDPVVFFLPAHNEEATVASLVARMPVRIRGHRVECVVIDDGSTDRTARQADAAGAQVVSFPQNRGLGAAVREGLRVATERHAAAAVFCDADGEYAPEELERLVAPILDGEADYVVGSRFAGAIEHMRPHRRLGNVALTHALRRIARAPISDGQSGYRALSPSAARSAEIAHDYNYAQVLTLDLLRKGFRYREVPISYRFRTSGRSFVRPGRYLLEVVPTVWRLVRQQPAAAQSSTTWVANDSIARAHRTRSNRPAPAKQAAAVHPIASA
jgi:glycosyltransferase involved in cell wall biosynthesis